jgi:hypothetical protein
MRLFPDLSSSGRLLIPLVVICLILAASLSLEAQVVVDLSLKRTLYIAYEPLLATVRITNLSGNRLLLSDVEGKKWFGFGIMTTDGTPIPPLNPDYQIPPIQIEAGESITRTINLTQLYPLGDLGGYRIQATVYATELGSYFSSPQLTFQISEGKLIWQQTVGVPDSPDGTEAIRTISLLTFRLPEKTDLYLRIEDKNAGIVYCTHRLGDFISYGKPDVMLDALNNVYVLQNTAPREFVYSKVGLDGKILDRLSYQSPGKIRPRLARTVDGNILVQGGIAFNPKAPPPLIPVPKLSDRPVAAALLNPSPESSSKSKSKNQPSKKAKPSPTPLPSGTPLKID